jgi:hypothetical protein
MGFSAFRFWYSFVDLYAFLFINLGKYVQKTFRASKTDYCMFLYSSPNTVGLDVAAKLDIDSQPFKEKAKWQCQK